jgi:hypothetical protein
MLLMSQWRLSKLLQVIWVSACKPVISKLSCEEYSGSFLKELEGPLPPEVTTLMWVGPRNVLKSP